MTLFNFLGLDLDQQAAIVWQGEFLADRSEGNNRMLLYRVYDFYAEVVYDSAANKITYIKGFNAISHLSPYVFLQK
jgi:hypothetical protein